MIGTPPITQINHPAEGVYGRPVGAGAGPGLLLSATELRAIASAYSAAQVDTLLLGKSDTGHGHSVGDISGLGTLATQNGTFSGTSSGTNTGDQSLTGLVPYTGATGAVNLGSFNLSCNATLVPSTGGVSLANDAANLNMHNSSGLVTFRNFNGGTGFRWMQNGTSVTEWMRLNISGRLLIGTTTDDTTGPLQVAGTITARNGLTPTSVQIHNTYTSGTNREWYDIRANTSLYEIGSAVGSAGGTNRPLSFGHRNAAGTFTNALKIAIDGKSFFGVATTTGQWLIEAQNYASSPYGLKLNSGGTDQYNEFRSTAGFGQFGIYNDALFFQADSSLANGLTFLTSTGTTALQIAPTTGKATFKAASTVGATINIPAGTAPTTPVNGDIWSDGTDLKVHLSGTNYTLTKA